MEVGRIHSVEGNVFDMLQPSYPNEKQKMSLTEHLSILSKIYEMYRQTEKVPHDSVVKYTMRVLQEIEDKLSEAQGVN